MLHLLLAPCQDQLIGFMGTLGQQWGMGREGGSQRILGILKEAEPAHGVGLANWQMWGGGRVQGESYMEETACPVMAPGCVSLYFGWKP